MGIPAFYKWVADRFPRAVADASLNILEFDNLYLDMNGIIHPCFHPEDLTAPKTYEEVFHAVFKYIDKVFSIVKPQKLLYLAIDGVAPRAKMNQQRSRRFRAAKDAADEAAQEEELQDESIEKSDFEPTSKLDSNVITPGTEFMAFLSSALRYYIHCRMNDDERWKGLKVILSDSSVPGEGEHKIMSYIRLQRNLPGFDPNTSHCLYGLDADLIMLALASHEIHFSILREDVQRDMKNKYIQRSDVKDKSSKSGENSSQKKKKKKKNNGPSDSQKLDDYISNQKFQFLHIWILREYLAYAMKIPDPTVNGDLERLIDDFVFMCLFVGNDFLPHMPSLEISEGAIDLLMAIYKKEFVRMGGYLTNSFEVNLARVKHFLEAVGSHEGLILRKRMQVQKGWAIRDRRSSKNKVVRTTSVGQDLINSNAMKIQVPKNSASVSTNIEVDKINFGEEGWKERYYAEKFQVETEDDREKVRRDVVLKYTEGICWVMHYYYEGVCSWQWFYPYHYAPFPSDFVDIDELQIQFTLGEPFKPFDQLMAVLPAASAHALPLYYRKLMTDASSPLLAFYPTDFELDMNGRRFSWQAICKLPFIEETSLLSEVARVENTLTDEERERNSLGMDVLFVHVSYPLAMKIITLYGGNSDHQNLTNANVKLEIDPNFSGGMNGYVFISDKPVQPVQIDSPIPGRHMIAHNKVLSVFYKCPLFHAHIPRPPEGVHYPQKSIRKMDVKPAPLLGHEKSAVVGRLHSLRPIYKSISGPRLAKSARLLVSKWYHEIEKQQKSKGNVEHGEGTTIVGSCAEGITIIASHAGGDGECINDKSRKRKRKTGKRKRKQNSSGKLGDIHVGENGPASISNRGEAVSTDDTRGDKSCSSGGADHGNKCSSGIHEDVNGLASISSNTGEAISGDDKSGSHGGAVGDSKCIAGKTRKRKRKPKQNNISEVCDIHESANGPASISNTVEGLSVDYTRGGSCNNSGNETCINGEVGSGLPEFYSSDDKPASISNLGAAVDNGDGGGGKSSGGKSRKRKQRRKQSSGCEVSNVSVGADEPASILNLCETSSLGVDGDDGGDCKSISGKRKLSSCGETLHVSIDANGLALISNAGEAISIDDTRDDKSSSHGGAVSDSKCISAKTKKRKRKQKPKQNNVSEVCDIHEGENGPASISNTTEAKSIDYARGESCNNSADGTCVNVEARSGLPEFYSSDDKPASISNLGAAVDNGDGGGDGKSTSGKSRKWIRRRKPSSGCEVSNVSVGADGPASILNLGETSSLGVDGADGGDCKSISEKRKPSSCGETLHVSIDANGLALISNAGEAISRDDTRDDKSSSHGGAVSDSKCISAKTKKRKRKQKPKQNNVSEVCDIHEGENGPASISNTTEAKSVDYARGESCNNSADGTRVNGETRSGLPEFYSSDDKPASISNLGAAVDNGDDGGDGKSTSGKSRKWIRRRKPSSGCEVSNVSVGADGPASILNLGETSSLGVDGDDGGDCKSISEKMKPSSGGETLRVSIDANGLALISNAGEAISTDDTRDDKSNSHGGTVGDSKCITGKTKKRKCKRKPKKNNVSEVCDIHAGENGSASISNTIEAKSVDYARGESCDNSADETRLNGEAGSLLPELYSSDDKPVSISNLEAAGDDGDDGGGGKSTSGKSVSDVSVGADGPASILNLGETLSVSGDYGGDGKSIGGKSSREKQSSGGELLSGPVDANGLALISNAGEPISVGGTS